MEINDKVAGYTLKEYLGFGTYGEVYRAEKDNHYINYALKFLLRKDEGIDKEKFDKEVANWKKANGHSNIITIYKSFIEHGKYVIVSDYAEGGSLKDKIFPVDRVIALIEGVLNGLSHLHSLNLIHRDIKPDNILLKNGVACISDFGLARDLNVTQSDWVGGSEKYFSPELTSVKLTQNDNSHESDYERTIHDDLWATAVTFYELIAGHLPFGSIIDRQNAKRQPIPENFPINLIEFFEKAFHKKRANRFQSAKEMKEALQNISKQEFERQRIEAEERESKLKRQFEVISRQKEIEKADLEQKLEAEKRKTQRLEEEKQKAEEKGQVIKINLQRLEDKIAILQNQVEESKKLGDEQKKENQNSTRQIKELENQVKKLASEQRWAEEEEKELAIEIEDNKESEKQILEELVINENDYIPIFPDVVKRKPKTKKKAFPLRNPPFEPEFLQHHQKWLIAGQVSVAAGILIICILVLIGFGLFGKDFYFKIAYNCPEKNPDCAIKNYNKAIELKPNFPEAYYNRGNVYRNKGNSDQAVEDFSKAIELKSNFAEAYNNRADIYANKGSYDKAIIDYNKLIELKPDFADAYHNRGVSYYHKGNYNQAITDYSKAIELKPDYAYIFNNRGHSYMKKGSYDQAIKDYSKAIELDPNNVEAYYNRGRSYEAKNNYNPAIKDYDKVIELKPDADVYFRRAYSYEEIGKHDQAIEDYSKVIELESNNESAYNNRGVSYDSKGNFNESINNFKKALEINPQYKLAKENLKTAIVKRDSN